MNEEQKQQAVTATKVDVKQKILFILSVIGLIGFGFAVALVAQDTILPEKEITQSTVTYEFAGSTMEEVKTQMLEKSVEMGLTGSQINKMVALVEENTTLGPWYDPRPRCHDCGTSRTGLCVFGGCAYGGCSGGGCNIGWEYRF